MENGICDLFTTSSLPVSVLSRLDRAWNRLGVDIENTTSMSATQDLTIIHALQRKLLQEQQVTTKTSARAPPPSSCLFQGRAQFLQQLVENINVCIISAVVCVEDLQESLSNEIEMLKKDVQQIQVLLNQLPEEMWPGQDKCKDNKRGSKITSVDGDFDVYSDSNSILNPDSASLLQQHRQWSAMHQSWTHSQNVALDKANQLRMQFLVEWEAALGPPSDHEQQQLHFIYTEQSLFHERLVHKIPKLQDVLFAIRALEQGRQALAQRIDERANEAWMLLQDIGQTYKRLRTRPASADAENQTSNKGHEEELEQEWLQVQGFSKKDMEFVEMEIPRLLHIHSVGDMKLFGVTNLNMLQFRESHQNLVGVYEKRRALLENYKITVFGLYQRLRMPEQDYEEFRHDHEGLDLTTIQEWEKQVQRFKEMESGRLAILLQEAESTLRKLWTELTTPKKDTIQFWQQHQELFQRDIDGGFELEPNELVPRHDSAQAQWKALQRLEQEIERLETRASRIRPILKLIERRQEIREKRQLLEIESKDPLRLFALNGRHDPGKLLREEKMRKEIEMLPRLEEALLKKIREYESLQGEIFWYFGENLGETIVAEMEAESKARELEKERRKAERKARLNQENQSQQQQHLNISSSSSHNNNNGTLNNLSKGSKLNSGSGSGSVGGGKKPVVAPRGKHSTRVEGPRPTPQKAAIQRGDFTKRSAPGAKPQSQESTLSMSSSSSSSSSSTKGNNHSTKANAVHGSVPNKKTARPGHELEGIPSTPVTKKQINGPGQQPDTPGISLSERLLRTGTPCYKSRSREGVTEDKNLVEDAENVEPNIRDEQDDDDMEDSFDFNEDVYTSELQWEESPIETRESIPFDRRDGHQRECF